MPKWKVWPSPPSVMSFNLHLIIHELEGIPMEGLQDAQNNSLMVQIEWRGNRRKTGIMLKGIERNCTSMQCIQANGITSWNEGFHHAGKLKMTDSKGFKSWIINLEILGIVMKTTTVAKAQVDIARFVTPGREENIIIPVECNIKGNSAEAALKVTIEFYENQTKGSTTSTLPRALSSSSFAGTRIRQTHDTIFQHPIMGIESNETSNSKFLPNQSTYIAPEDFSPQDTMFNYQKLATTKFLLTGHLSGKFEFSHKEKTLHRQQSQQFPNTAKRQPSLLRLFSSKNRKFDSRAVHHCKETPLLNKTYGGDGGDDIDNDRRHQLRNQFSPTQVHVQQAENAKAMGFGDDGHFEIGSWEEKKILSRDRQMELVTEIFLASIDQCSEKAAGGGACTVIAVVIAEWLHKNPKTLPLRCQFDDLVRGGSSEWRKLCANDNHKEKFSDQHFDLDTVLEAKVRPLSVVTKMSYVGFFGLDNIPDSIEGLQGAMTFDSIWQELRHAEVSEEQVYIASWNDHFFVLKVENDAIYLIDTLGERLFEGCNQAYILKFNKESKVCRVQSEHNEEAASTEFVKTVPKNGFNVDDDSSHHVLCAGMDACKEYIKGFLAALPLRELQHDIERGLVGKSPLHRRLQIEFHYTVPSSLNS